MAAFEKIWPFVLGINIKVKMIYQYDLSHRMVKQFKQFVGNLPTICLSVSDHFLGLAP